VISFIGMYAGFRSNSDGLFITSALSWPFIAFTLILLTMRVDYSNLDPSAMRTYYNINAIRQNTEHK
jgi:hypothetical protein